MKSKIFILLLFIAVLTCKGNKNELSRNTQKSEDKLSLEILVYEPSEELGYCRKSIFKIKQNNQYINSITDELGYDCCDSDNGIDYFNNSIKVTDLDKNNYKEISFIYRKRCSSDVSPHNLKAILYDTKSKIWYTINGSSTSDILMDLYNMKTGHISKVSKNMPAPFLSFLKKEWTSYSIDEEVPQNKAVNNAEIIYQIEKTKNSKETLVNNITKAKFTSSNLELTLLDNSVLKFTNPVFFADNLKAAFYNNSIVLYDWNLSSGISVKSYWHFDEKKNTLMLYKISKRFRSEDKYRSCVLKDINFDIKSIDGSKIMELLQAEENCR